MRVVTFRHAGKVRVGVADETHIVDLSARGLPYASVRAAIAAGHLVTLERHARGVTPDFRLDEVEFLPPVPDPEKILCVGLNYATHVGEMDRALPREPSLFSRLHNTLLGHGAALIRPRASTQFDFEGELAVVIGRTCRAVTPERALEMVAGYCCFLDGSVRDYQKHSVTAGKNFPATAPVGPWLVPAEEIGDPQKLRLTTRLNGVVVQDDTTDHMIFDVAAIIAYVSTVTWLEPGDIIATGTPAGVGHGRKPPLWMKAGDRVEVEISGIGTLANHVVDE